MANKAANISDLIHRVACSCLTHHQFPGSNSPGIHETDSDSDESEEEINGKDQSGNDDETTEKSSSESTSPVNIWEGEKGIAISERVREMEGLMSEVFEAVSAVKRAYVSLQGAHCPWDPARMRAADAAVVAELRRLGRLRDRFRRGAVWGPAAAASVPPMREAVAPYEAALEEVRRELRAKEAEIEGLKEKLRSRGSGSGRRWGSSSGRRLGFSSGLGSPAVAPTPELFEACTEEVKSASKSFAARLLSLMRSARWDLSAAARSILESSDPTADCHVTIPEVVDPAHARHALHSYITRSLFQGFDNEAFYIDGSLSSLLNPSEFRRSCFSQFRDMRSMDPAELLGILPTCHFGRFAAKKYLSLVPPKMEEALFGGLELRRHVTGGVHPRTGFYGEYFLRAAKAVWMLHLLAFAMDPPPSHFEASRGAEFHAEYMESVVRYAGGRVPGGSVVGFSVGPGFKLVNGSVVRARVYLVPRAKDA